jgi:NADPH-dependent 2,4-dienoyl-CoA reductase/sulfur reductase-like enzyme
MSTDLPLRRDVRRLVVVGAGLAGASVVNEARALGFAGEVTLVGCEAAPPYDRPPLSKDHLVDDAEPGLVPLLADDVDVTLRLGTAATGLDVRKRVVSTTAGELRYDALVIATGSAPRPLPDLPSLDGVTALRTATDASSARARIDTGAHVVVVGAGFIGGEVASSARRRGAEVTMVEALDLPLVHAVGPLVAERLACLHREHGVEMRTGRVVKELVGTDRVEKVRLDDGSVLAADLVVVGIGVTPVTGWLKGSGVALNDGVACTPYLESTVPDVWAAGDVARWVNPWSGRSVRMEHWTAATEQAQAVVRNALTTEPAPCRIVPYFWSEWHGHRIQMLGEPSDEVEVTVSGGATDPFHAIYRYDGKLVGGFALDSTRDLMRRRASISERRPWQEALNRPA